MEKTLQSGWFEVFRKKLLADFGLDVRGINNYQSDMAPIVYCCLQHRRVSPKPRNVILSKEFQKNSLANDKEWMSIQNDIQKGRDINLYMSKKINDWQAVDYLLYTCNISHFHLYKNKEGGIREHLVFGIFTKENFYALNIGKHGDLYKPDDFISIVVSNWPELLDAFKVKKAPQNTSAAFNSKLFKQLANNTNLQCNLIAPAPFIDHDNQRKELDNHQNTGLIKVELNGIDIGKIPCRVWCAYLNEIGYLQKLDAKLFARYGAKNMSLEMDIKNKCYSIEIHRQRSIKINHKIPKKFITCSLYHKNDD
ncbi:hypothetical protein [Laribacter hongkongensis]|uniref:hypothetical protein n=1 Tax=Laribacter hongkongensis TaxID=168471 RepID=UPI001EFCF0D2|nr:hypothetical protein [Laribacter hongkongensis]MCG9096220.1 hypothetical protein [Laribacter hongkongensis]